MGVKRRKVPTLSGLPNPMIGKTGDLYTSLANFSVLKIVQNLLNIAPSLKKDAQNLSIRS